MCTILQFFYLTEFTPCGEFKMATNSLQPFPSRGRVYFHTPWIWASLENLTSRIWWHDIVWLPSWGLKEDLKLLRLPLWNLPAMWEIPSSPTTEVMWRQMRPSVNCQTCEWDHSAPQSTCQLIRNICINPTNHGEQRQVIAKEPCPKRQPIEFWAFNKPRDKL